MKLAAIIALSVAQMISGAGETIQYHYETGQFRILNETGYAMQCYIWFVSGDVGRYYLRPGSYTSWYLQRYYEDHQCLRVK